jgi:hypothetical protein
MNVEPCSSTMRRTRLRTRHCLRCKPASTRSMSSSKSRSLSQMIRAAYFTERTALAHLPLRIRAAHRAAGGTVPARVHFLSLYRTRVPTSAFAVAVYRPCARNCLPLLAQPAAHHLTATTARRRQIPFPARQRNNIYITVSLQVYTGRESLSLALPCKTIFSSSLGAPGEYLRGHIVPKYCVCLKRASTQKIAHVSTRTCPSM